MHTKELIEDLVTSGLKGLCMNCLHNQTCIYHKATTRHIIQCELYSLDEDSYPDPSSPNGLCRTCDLAADCTLPGRRSGVWHCNEYK
jgi:hypothetical protein